MLLMFLCLCLLFSLIGELVDLRRGQGSVQVLGEEVQQAVLGRPRPPEGQQGYARLLALQRDRIGAVDVQGPRKLGVGLLSLPRA